VASVIHGQAFAARAGKAANDKQSIAKIGADIRRSDRCNPREKLLAAMLDASITPENIGVQVPRNALRRNLRVGPKIAQ
jgi:hypothetical protein